MRKFYVCYEVYIGHDTNFKGEKAITAEAFELAEGEKANAENFFAIVEKRLKSNSKNGLRMELLQILSWSLSED